MASKLSSKQRSAAPDKPSERSHLGDRCPGGFLDAKILDTYCLGMKMNQGVEWALHSCVNMSWIPAGEAVSSARLAELYKLPPAYLNKQLQALVRAGILESVSGPKGGFQLARRPDKISVLDVVLAIEGKELAFRCDGILKNGPGGDMDGDYAHSCLISQAMRHAELAWRTELARQSVAGIAQSIERRFPEARPDTLAQLLGATNAGIRAER